MKAELIIPIDSLRGCLRKDGYYFRLYRGVQLVQRCPNRKRHERTLAEIANQRHFAMVTREVNKRVKQGDKRSHKAIWREVSEAYDTAN